MKKLTTLLVTLMLLFSTAAYAEDTGADDPYWAYQTWLMESGELQVQGRAVRTVVPDTVTIKIGASIENSSERAAQEEANTIINGVIAELKVLGLEDKQIKTSGYNVTRRYQRKIGGITTGDTYVATVSITVTVQDFELINQILDIAAEKGANSVGNINFSYSDEGEVYRQALEDAVLAAKAKAEIMALAGGVEIITLSRMTEGSQGGAYYNSYAPAEMDMAETAAEGGAQVMAGELEISANVTLTYRTR